MAAYDIVPVDFRDATSKMLYARLTAAEAFLPGELVFVNAAGSLEEFADAGGQATLAQITGGGNVAGVAAQPGNTVNAAPGGSARFAFTTYPSTLASGLNATGDLVGFYPADEGIVFQTTQFHAAGGAGAAAIPAGADVGDMFQLSKPNAGAQDNRWGIEETAGVAGTDVVAKVVRVLNNRGEDIGLADTTTGVTVHFTLHVNTA